LTETAGDRNISVEDRRIDHRGRLHHAIEHDRNLTGTRRAVRVNSGRRARRELIEALRRQRVPRRFAVATQLDVDTESAHLTKRHRGAIALEHFTAGLRRADTHCAAVKCRQELCTICKKLGNRGHSVFRLGFGGRPAESIRLDIVSDFRVNDGSGAVGQVDHRPEFDNAGHADAAQGFFFIFHPGQVDHDVGALHAHIGLSDAAPFKRGPDEVANDQEVSFGRTFLGSQDD